MSIFHVKTKPIKSPKTYRNFETKSLVFNRHFETFFVPLHRNFETINIKNS
jgi:hypothetical protein